MGAQLRPYNMPCSRLPRPLQNCRSILSSYTKVLFSAPRRTALQAAGRLSQSIDGLQVTAYYASCTQLRRSIRRRARGGSIAGGAVGQPLQQTCSDMYEHRSIMSPTGTWNGPKLHIAAIHGMHEDEDDMI